MSSTNQKQFLPLIWVFFLLPVVALYSALNPLITSTSSSNSRLSEKLSAELTQDLEQSQLNQEQSITSEHSAQEPQELQVAVRAGDTLSKILSAQGVSAEKTQSIISAFADAGVSPAALSRGEEIVFARDSQGELLGIRKKFGEGKELILTANADASFKSEIVAAEIVETEKVVSGVIESCFADAAKKNSVPYSVVDDLVDVLGARVEFRKDLQPGDTFSLVYVERKTKGGELLSPGLLKSASIVNEGKFIAAVADPGSHGKAVYFDETGAVYGSYFLRYPLQFSRISSVFSSARFHPVLGINRPHNGVDFAAPTGTPVRAVADGRVIKAGYAGGAGLMISLEHNSTYDTAYMHLSKLAAGVRIGSKVTRGQVIGAVGSSGLATGPHLHFSLFQNGKYVDPLKAKLPTLDPTGSKIPQVVLAAEISRLKEGHGRASAIALANVPAKKHKI